MLRCKDNMNSTVDSIVLSKQSIFNIYNCNTVWIRSGLNLLSPLLHLFQWNFSINVIIQEKKKCFVRIYTSSCNIWWIQQKWIFFSLKNRRFQGKSVSKCFRPFPHETLKHSSTHWTAGFSFMAFTVKIRRTACLQLIVNCTKDKKCACTCVCFFPY